MNSTSGSVSRTRPWTSRALRSAGSRSDRVRRMTAADGRFRCGLAMPAQTLPRGQLPQSGRTSIVPIRATGCPAAISTASSRLSASTRSKPPTASLVSANLTVGDARLPVANANRAGASRRSELVAGDPLAPRLEVVQPGEALVVGLVTRLGLGQGVHVLGVPTDDQQKLHRRSLPRSGRRAFSTRRTRRTGIDNKRRRRTDRYAVSGDRAGQLCDCWDCCRTSCINCCSICFSSCPDFWATALTS